MHTKLVFHIIHKLFFTTQYKQRECCSINFCMRCDRRSDRNRGVAGLLVALLLRFLLLSVDQVDLLLKRVGVGDILSLLDVLNTDVVFVLVLRVDVVSIVATEVDIAVAFAAHLRDRQGLLVGLVVGPGDNLLVEVGHLVGATVSERVLAQHDTLAEHLVVPSRPVAVIRLLLQVREAGTVVGLVRVTIGAETVLVVVASVVAVALLLGALVVRGGRRIPTRVAVQSVSMTLSIEVGVVARSVAAATAISSTMGVAAMRAVSAAILVVSAIASTVAVVAIITIARRSLAVSIVVWVQLSTVAILPIVPIIATTVCRSAIIATITARLTTA